MKKAIEDMTRQELENEIFINEDGLYEMFDEQKLLKNEYTFEELLEITQKWIQEAPEFIYETVNLRKW